MTTVFIGMSHTQTHLPSHPLIHRTGAYSSENFCEMGAVHPPAGTE
ncbi:MAG: hypothetical protein KME16_04440 [Scytolyngbya sp. HA4215-MV1]|nr:hypothetical protein [Scytolyngbya sp. HA4215-MV1]